MQKKNRREPVAENNKYLSYRKEVTCVFFARVPAIVICVLVTIIVTSFLQDLQVYRSRGTPVGIIAECSVDTPSLQLPSYALFSSSEEETSVISTAACSSGSDFLASSKTRPSGLIR